MRFGADLLTFAPMVPPAYAGDRTLSNVHYRGAVLTITVRGYGDRVAGATLDGRPLPHAEVPATLTGAHTVEIRMNGQWPAGRISLVDNRWTPETPVTTLRADTLAWAPVAGAVRYVVYRDGRATSSTARTSTVLPPPVGLAEYQVMAVDEGGIQSFLSEPVRREGRGVVTIARPAGAPLEHEHTGFSGAGYVRLTRTANTRVEVPVRIACAGTYDVDTRYSNGNGPVNTDAKAAVRTLLVDGREAGVLVMPQRGVDAWNLWGFGTPVRVSLSAGSHNLALVFTPLDENMDRHENTALLDYVRVTRVGPCR
jgi:hypothetical protein